MTLKELLTTAMVVLLIFCFSVRRNATADEKELPYLPGEKLTYEIKWGLITAAEAVLEVDSSKTIEGVQSLHFKLTVKTSPFVDLFYKVRDRLESFVDAEMTHSVLYKKETQGHSHKRVRVDFDWTQNEAQYSNHGKKRLPTPIQPGSFDPLGVIYAFRTFDLREGKNFEGPVTDGKKCVMGRAKVLSKEKIEVGGREIDAYHVKPDLQHIAGIFEKSEDSDIDLWFSTDPAHIPLRVRSRVVIGSFSGELVSAEGLKARRTPPLAFR
jgi:hypothetical protein